MKANSIIRCGCALVFVALMSQNASAQRFFGSRTNSLTSLAATESVQKHLGVAGEAVNRLNAISDEYRTAIQKEYTALGIDYSAISDLPAAEREVEMRKASEKTDEENRKFDAEFLTKLQVDFTHDTILRLGLD